MKIIVTYIYLTALILIVSSCSMNVDKSSHSNEQKKENNSELLYATLYHQHAAEVDALAFQAFNWAKAVIKEDSKRMGVPRKPAVIVDIDETILDNTPYQADCIIEEYSYPVGWDEWMKLSKCEALPGALDFVKYAKSLKYEIFYVTNRKEIYRQPTLENLKKLGFPFADDKHLLMRTETSSKEARRNNIAGNYHIVLLMGDNLGDFSSVFDDIPAGKRIKAVDSLRNEFGFKYIVLPNAMYGNWQSSLIDKQGLSSKEKSEYLKSKLEGF